MSSVQTETQPITVEQLRGELGGVKSELSDLKEQLRIAHEQAKQLEGENNYLRLENAGLALEHQRLQREYRGVLARRDLAVRVFLDGPFSRASRDAASLLHAITCGGHITTRDAAGVVKDIIDLNEDHHLQTSADFLSERLQEVEEELLNVEEKQAASMETFNQSKDAKEALELQRSICRLEDTINQVKQVHDSGIEKMVEALMPGACYVVTPCPIVLAMEIELKILESRLEARTRLLNRFHRRTILREAKRFTLMREAASLMITIRTLNQY